MGSTRKAAGLKGFLTAISLSEYGSEGFRVWLRRLSEYGSIAYLVERPIRETQAEQCSDTPLFNPQNPTENLMWVPLWRPSQKMRQINFFLLGVQNGALLVGGLKFYVGNVYVFFVP